MTLWHHAFVLLTILKESITLGGFLTSCTCFSPQAHEILHCLAATLQRYVLCSNIDNAEAFTQKSGMPC